MVKFPTGVGGKSVGLQSAFFIFYKTAVTHRDGQHALQNQLNAFNISIHEAQPYSLDRWRARPFRIVFGATIQKEYIFEREEKQQQQESYLAYSLCNNNNNSRPRERERERDYFFFMIHVIPWNYVAIRHRLPFSVASFRC